MHSGAVLSVGRPNFGSPQTPRVFIGTTSLAESRGFFIWTSVSSQWGLTLRPWAYTLTLAWGCTAQEECSSSCSQVRLMHLHSKPPNRWFAFPLCGCMCVCERVAVCCVCMSCLGMCDWTHARVRTVRVEHVRKDRWRESVIESEREADVEGWRGEPCRVLHNISAKQLRNHNPGTA